MTAFTQKTSGNGDWATTGLVVWNQTGYPGDGDTASIGSGNSGGYYVDVTGSETVGDDSGVVLNAGAADGVHTNALNIKNGGSLRVKGSIDSEYGSNFAIQVEAGGTLIIDPSSASARTYGTVSYNGPFSINANGTALNRCSITCDLTRGGQVYALTTGNHTYGFWPTVQYCDIANFGTSSAYGVYTNFLSSDAGSSIIENNTLDNCTWLIASGSSYDGNFSIQNNVLTNTPSNYIGGYSDVSVAIGLGGAGTSGTWNFSNNSLDKGLRIYTYRPRMQFTRNIVKWYAISSGSWSSEDNFNNILVTDGVTNNQGIGGPAHDIFFLMSTATNPHFAGAGSATGTTTTVRRLVFQGADSNDGAGDCLLISGSTSATLNVINCIVLPSNGVTSGKLGSPIGASSGLIMNFNHNTYWGVGGESGLLQLNENYNSYVGEVGSCQSNIIYSPTSGQSYCKAIHSSGGTPATDDVTLAGYNAFRNPTTGTCYYNTSTSQSVTGYHGLKISANTPFPNSQIGDNDVTLTGHVFVWPEGSPYLIGDWGADKGEDGTTAAAVAFAQANLTATFATDTGLIDSIFANWSVTGSEALSVLKDAGHDSVTIGAAPYVAGVGGIPAIRMRSFRNRSLLRR